jgi:hypothetical protein
MPFFGEECNPTSQAHGRSAAGSGSLKSRALAQTKCSRHLEAQKREGERGKREREENGDPFSTHGGTPVALHRNESCFSTNRVRFLFLPVKYVVHLSFAFRSPFVPLVLVFF